MKSPSQKLLMRVLEAPQTVEAIRRLEAPTFHALVQRIGIADAGELVAMATDEQLQHLLDETMWEQRPGEPEVFSRAAFVTWLEVLLEGGEDYMVRRVCALPSETIALGIHRVVLVVDVETFGIDMASADDESAERAERALDECLSLELDGYALISRGVEGWDAIVALLTALDRQHHELRNRLLEICRRASTAVIEDEGGLFAVLNAEATLEADTLADREDRRSAQGYVDPPSARGFLGLARTTPLRSLRHPLDRDIASTRYWKTLAAPARPRPPSAGGRTSRGLVTREPLEDLLEELEINVVTAPSLAPGPADTVDALSSALAQLRDEDAVAHGQRMAELAYLTQVLVAGEAHHDGTPYGWQDAANEAIRMCRRGLARLYAATGHEISLREIHLDILFRWGAAT